MLMERAGTGGSIFRNLYRDFLKESYDLLKIEGINEAYKDFKEIAQLWKNVSDLFYKVGETSDIKYINEASEILLMLSEKERIAMEKLKNAST
jgi:general stress protein 26